MNTGSRDAPRSEKERSPLCLLSTSMSIRSTACWTAFAGSTGWPAGSGSWASPPWPSRTTGSCTAPSTSTGPASGRASSPSSAARCTSRPPAGPALTRSTSWTRRAAIWSSCAGTRRGTATSATWSAWASQRASTSSPGWTWTCCAPTAAGSSPSPPVWPGRSPSGWPPATTPPPRPGPWSCGTSLARTASIWSSRTTASAVRSLSTRAFCASTRIRASPWCAPTTATI